MKNIRRPLPVMALVAALAIAACSGTPTSTAGTPAPGSTLPSGTGPAGTTAPGAELDSLPTELLVPVFGAQIPTPTCSDLSGGGRQCRWIVGDGALLVDAEVQTEFATEAEWREAFTTAGFDEEIPGVGVAALGGANPLADGYRATAYTSEGLAFSVIVNKAGDQAAVKAIVIAILTALVS